MNVRPQSMSMLSFHRKCIFLSGCIPFYSAGSVAEGHGFISLSTLGICHLLILAIVLLKKLLPTQEHLLSHGIFWTSMWSPKSKSSVSLSFHSLPESPQLYYTFGSRFVIPQSLFISLILQFSKEILFLCYGFYVFCYFSKILLICLFGIFLLAALLVSSFYSCLCFIDFSASKLEMSLKCPWSLPIIHI